MANKKISELNINTSPTYSDALPIVNSGITKQITLSGITDFLSNTSLKFPEAPIDGNQYARQDGDWVVIESQLNEITFSAGFTIDTDEVTMLSGWTWTIDGSGYTNTSDVVITIPAASVDYRRIDLIVADTSNSFYLVQGIESNDIPVAPNLPADTLQATFITVNGDVIDVTPVEGNFVTLDTAQTIIGAKLFTQDIFINNMRVGIGMGNLDTNVVFGANAFTGNTIGTFNVGIGQNSLQKNIIGNNNTAIGAFTLYNSTGSSFNVAIGTSALQNSTTGDQNIGIGASSLRNNTTGVRNIGIGASSLINNIVGISNTAIGNQALFRSIGDYNIGIGRNAGAALVSGNKNIFITNDTTSSTIGLKDGSNNIYLGSSNTGILTGSSNVIIGTVSGLSSTLSNNVILADGSGNQRLKVNENGIVNIVTTPTTNTSNTGILSRNSSTGNIEIVPVSAITSGITTPNLQQVTNVNNTTSNGIYIDNPIGGGNVGTPYVGGVPRYLFTGFGDGTTYPGTYAYIIQADLEEWINIAAADGTSATNITSNPYEIHLAKHYQALPSKILKVGEFGIGIQTSGLTGYINGDNLTSQRTYQLPNADGTLALLSDITGGTGSSNLQSVLEAGNMADFNSGNTSTRLPNESDHSINISSTNTNSGNHEFYTLFGAEGSFIAQVGEYNAENPYYGDKTIRMDANLLYFENNKYKLPEDEDASKGRVTIGNDNVLLYAQNYETQLFSEAGLYPSSFYAQVSDETGTNAFSLDINTAQFNKGIDCNSGLRVINSYGTVEFGTLYSGGSPKFIFQATGDGVDFPADSSISIFANIEEGFGFNTSDGTGNASSTQFSPYSLTIQHSSSEPNGNSNLYLSDSGVGVQTISNGGYFRADNLTDERTYQLPDANGVIALLSDITGSTGGNFLPLTGTSSGATVTGDIEFGTILTGLKRIDGDVTKRVWFNDDGWIALNNYNPVTGNFASVDVANGSIYLNSQLDGLSNYLNIDNDGIRTGKRIYMYDVEYTDFGSIRFNDNQFIVDGAGSPELLNVGLGAFQILNTNNRNSLLNFSNIATTNKSFTFPNATGTVAVVGTTAPSGATATGVVGEIRVTSAFTYTCIATNTWVRSVAATW